MNESFERLKLKFMKKWRTAPDRTVLLMLLLLAFIVWLVQLFVLQTANEVWIRVVFLILGVIMLILDIARKRSREIYFDIGFLLLVAFALAAVIL